MNKTSTHHDDIEKDQYDKINTLAAKVEGLTSAVDVLLGGPLAVYGQGELVISRFRR